MLILLAVLLIQTRWGRKISDVSKLWAFTWSSNLTCNMTTFIYGNWSEMLPKNILLRNAGFLIITWHQGQSSDHQLNSNQSVLLAKWKGKSRSYSLKVYAYNSKRVNHCNLLNCGNLKMKFKCLHVNKKKKSMKHDQGENSSTEQSSYLKRINYTLKSSIKKFVNKGKNAHMPDHVILYFLYFCKNHLLTLYTLNYCQKKMPCTLLYIHVMQLLYHTPCFGQISSYGWYDDDLIVFSLISFKV